MIPPRTTSSRNPHQSSSPVAIVRWKKAFARGRFPYETEMSIVQRKRRTLYYQIFHVADCQTITAAEIERSPAGAMYSYSIRRRKARTIRTCSRPLLSIISSCWSWVSIASRDARGCYYCRTNGCSIERGEHSRRFCTDLIARAAPF